LKTLERSPKVKRRSFLTLAGGVTAALTLPVTPVTAAESVRLSGAQRRLLLGYATDTWRSMAAMVHPATGLAADNIDGSLDAATRAAYTSPTNIASSLWSALAARELGVISRAETRRHVRDALDALATLERHPFTGMFYNWYDPGNGAKLTVWPVDGSTLLPFLSSVDNAWLAAALIVLGNDDSLGGRSGSVGRGDTVAAAAGRILEGMDFRAYYDEAGRGAGFGAGTMRGGFWPDQPPDPAAVRDNYHGRGPDVWYTGHHYDTLGSETRIISYVAIALGQVPPEHYFATFRTFEPTCDWSWQEMKPVGEHRSYLGIPVFEGAYRYRGLQFVPTWGGDMFEALMPDLFVPEARWAPNSWGRNHPVYVRGQIEHGLHDAGYGHWGFSPASDPFGGYREYGVEPMGLNADGYTSDKERTLVDFGFEGCAGRDPKPLPAAYGDGVVTPHAVFLALPYAPAEALAELAALRRDFDSYGAGGFYDSVAVRSGTVARRHLALDQGMIMAALGNLLAGDAIRERFIRGQAGRALRPVLGLEEFFVPAGEQTADRS
jgi:putative glucoamylase/uncharacterized protein DUF3131